MAVAGDRMMRPGGGSIVNISSIGAERPSPPEAMYAAAKNGLNALTRGVRPGVRARTCGSTA